MSQDSLIGCWRMIKAEGDVETGERVEMEFEPSGRLVYGILHGSDRWQLMILTYRVDGDVLISDQPSHPREERSRFFFPEHDVLCLEQPDNKSLFERIETRGFSLPEKKTLLQRLGFKK